jgi:hypothetical protein
MHIKRAASVGRRRSGTVWRVENEERGLRAGGWLALLLPISAPAALLGWVAASMADQSWSLALLPLPFLAIWAARPSVNAFLTALGRTSRAEGLVQFTPGYFAFHAHRAGVPSGPFWAVFVLLAGALALGWLTLMVGAFIG